ncbi:hypothetical protein F7018_15930 [Tenacibaculum aiptasiae]|uniref:Uncharacterized protein n=1 Tax=Tenacibaculum aiptasiae TaxID=426481 RepID=A0A7J5A8S2_9FLAO|nr:hypothetical protein [Tenacibaculum aiptasiae]KAB1153972.1 hypothetical protein F7018_15930 [Tenacibaculum aiptasiae]
MKEHDYLNLKIGDIEQYSMVVKKKDLPKWKKLGWLEYTEIGLPEGDEEAYMLYGEIKKDEQLIFNRPKLFKQTEKESLIDLEIIDFSTHLGTYGMGGAGFFGLLLSNDQYLTYAVWNAGEYVLINNRVVECNPDLYNKTKPWVSNYGDDKTWNFLTEYISGGKIIDYTISHDSFEMEVSNKGEVFKINFVKNDKRLPRKVGRKRNAYKKGQVEDYILFQHKDGTLIV